MNPFETSASPEAKKEQLDQIAHKQIAELKKIESEKEDPKKTVARIAEAGTLRILKEEGV